MKNILVFIVLILFSCNSYKQLDKTSSKDYEGVLELTKNGLGVYFVFSHKNGGTNYQYLMTGMELWWAIFPKLELETTYIDTLRRILKNHGNLDITSDFNSFSLDEYVINRKTLDSLNNLSKHTIYERYFNDLTGMAKERIDEEEMKAAVAALIEKGVTVHQGQYSMYNVFVIPSD